MLLHEWAFRIEPFEHDVFAFVLGKRMRLALGIGRGKIRRGAPDRRRIGGEKRGGKRVK